MGVLFKYRGHFAEGWEAYRQALTITVPAGLQRGSACGANVRFYESGWPCQVAIVPHSVCVLVTVVVSS
jgi:hypothetical protein